MPEETTAQVHTRMVIARHGELMESVNTILKVFPFADDSKKLNICQAARDQAKALRDGLAPQDQPKWLSPIEGALQRFCAKHTDRECASRLNTEIARHWIEMNGQNWEFREEDIAFDFDRVFDRYYSNSNIPALFDKLVELLTQLIEAKDEDGRYVVQNRGAIEAIEKLIATLRRNRRASLYSIVCTYEFVKTIAKKFAWKRLERYDLIEDVVASFEETVSELSGEMEDVQGNTGIQLQSTISVDFYALEVNQNILVQGEDVKQIGNEAVDGGESEAAESEDA